jgi:hypothetical protein
MPRSGITGSYGSSIFIFLRNLHTAFHNGCTDLHSHQQCIRVLISPHPCQHLWLLLPLNMNILTRVRWNLCVVLICIPFITKEVEHFSSCIDWPFVPLPLRIPYLIMCPFLHWGVDYLGVEFFEFPIDSGYWSLIRWVAGKDFLPFCGLCWVWWLFSLLCRSNLVWCILFILSLWCWACWVLSRKLFPIPIQNHAFNYRLERRICNLLFS